MKAAPVSRSRGSLLATLAGALMCQGVTAGNAGSAADPFLLVPLPPLELRPGDVTAPLPPGSPLPSSDPRDLEGTWAGIGATVTIDGKRAPYLPSYQAGIKRRADMEAAGTPVIDQGSLCRPPGSIAVSGNQFPTQIIQRPDKLVFIAEENRGIWHVYMNAKHPRRIKPSYTGHSVGRWEGNTLVIDSVGFNGKTNSSGFFGVSGSPKLRVVTRITRANTGDRLNGDILLISRTYDDPDVFEHPWTEINRARWRPDLEMLEFNCEESASALIHSGLSVE